MTEKNKKQSRINFKFILLLAIIVLIVGFYVDAKVLSVKRLRVQEVSLESNKVPESFHKSKILIFSDIMGDLDQLEKVKTNVKKYKPDFIIFLGNLMSDNTQDKDLIEEYLEAMDAPLGKYALLARSDYQNDLEDTKQIFSNADFRLQETSLVNVYNKTNEKIQFVFIDYDGAGVESSEKVIDSVDLDALVLAYAYNPAQIDNSNIGVHTLFSSKNKNSKVNIPYLSQMIYDDKYLNKHQVIKDVNLRLTTGISTEKPLFRLFSSPDIILVTLRSSS